MRSLPVGTRGTYTTVVTPDQLASRFKDAMLPPVLATPVMIMIMENAALDAMKPWFDRGETALGTRVDVRHLAATPVGRRVTGEAMVTAVDGRRVGTGERGPIAQLLLQRLLERRRTTHGRPPTVCGGPTAAPAIVRRRIGPSSDGCHTGARQRDGASACRATVAGMDDAALLGEQRGSWYSLSE